MIALTLTLTAALLNASPAPDYALLHIQRNTAKVTSVEGTMTQGGLVESAEVKANIVSARPNLFSAKITEPAVWAGISVTYDGKTLQSYYPMLRWAVRLRNLELPKDPKQVEQLVAYQYDLNQRTYDYRIDGTSTVAGLSTLTMWHTALAKGTLDAKGFTRVYDPYSFALAGELHFPRSTYTYKWDTVSFNKPVAPESFSTAVPEGTLISDFDLAQANVDEAAMRKEATFPIVLPDKNGLELKRTGIARVAGPVAAFAVRYDRGPHFLLVLANASAGASVPAYGIPLELGGTTGRLVLGPQVSTYAFVREGTYYTLIGNIPSEELIKVATLMGTKGAL